MKLFPRTTDLFNDVFDDMWNAPFNNSLMKTDITEKDGNYMLDMELPGCKKEDITITLQEGCLNISASRNTSKEEKDDKGKLIRQERTSGSYSRSFYVGDGLKEEDIKASYENGELKITFPKESEKLPENKTIMIE